MYDLLINRELLKGRGLITNGAKPLGALFLELEIGRGIKALDVRAAEATARKVEAHIRERALEG